MANSYLWAQCLRWTLFQCIHIPHSIVSLLSFVFLRFELLLDILLFLVVLLQPLFPFAVSHFSRGPSGNLDFKYFLQAYNFFGGSLFCNWWWQVITASGNGSSIFARCQYFYKNFLIHCHLLQLSIESDIFVDDIYHVVGLYFIILHSSW